MTIRMVLKGGVRGGRGSQVAITGGGGFFDGQGGWMIWREGFVDRQRLDEE